MKNFGHSQTSSLVSRPKIFTNTKATPQSLPLRFCESQNLSENQAKIAESSLDSAESQNLNQNNPRVSAHLESRPLRGAKNRIQASSSGKADFLLEAEKRGSPPKSEKRQLLGTYLKKVGGGQPFCGKNQMKMVVREAQNLVKNLSL